MTTSDFRICVKAELLDIKKRRDLEVFRISRDGVPIMDIRYQDIFAITSFRDWFNAKIGPPLPPVRLSEDEQRMYDAHIIP